MKNKLNEELKDIKYLFNYNRGRVISEQERFDDKEEFVNYDDINYDDEEELVDYEDIDKDLYPSFDGDGNFLGMAKPMGDMDTRTPEASDDFYPRTPKASDDFYPRTPKERERDMRDIDMEIDEEMDLPVMLPGTKEKERTKVKPGTKPKTPSTPYKPKPGPKPDPKARKRKGDMPTWLTFDELGIDFE
jgi:hypothetical protein